MHRSPWRPTARGLVGGEAEPAGVAEACRNEDLEVLDEGGGGQVACHWARARLAT